MRGGVGYRTPSHDQAREFLSPNVCLFCASLTHPLPDFSHF